MSSANQVLNTGQQAITNYNTAKIFIYNNRFQNETYINSGYVAVSIPAGTVMGRIGASQTIVPLVSTATDGSQYPVGILGCDLTNIAAGASVGVTLCISGDVAQEQIVLQGSDTLKTLIGTSNRSIFDHIVSDTMGIKIVPTSELTQTDNQ
jgi:hypothetical protein